MIVPALYNGPPGSGNGGWCCGLFSTIAPDGGVPEVMLRMPPPLDVPLVADGDSVLTTTGDVVATVSSAPTLDPPPPPVEWDAAVTAAGGYAGLVPGGHPFPTCYVCGPARPDGLRIFPGPVAAGGVAAPFVAPEDVARTTVWAALDCPGGWAVISPGRPYVLGRMAAAVAALPAPGDECVVVGVCDGVEGRKAAVRTALYTRGGDLVAHARATWIAI